jgi:ribosomal protein S27E
MATRASLMSTKGHLGVAGRTARPARVPNPRRAASVPLREVNRMHERRGAAGLGPSELERDALTARGCVLTIQRSKGSKRKDSRLDEEALIVWQDVLDMVVNGRPNEVACPYCNHRPLTIEEIEQSTRISCSKCGKFIQGRFTH